MENGISTSLGDDQIGPLHDDNGDEKGRVTGPLQHLAPLISLRGKTREKQEINKFFLKGRGGGRKNRLKNESYPFLAVSVLQIVDRLRLPAITDAHESTRPESVLSHDHKVGEEAGGRLNHTDLTVGQSNQTLIHQSVHFGVARATLHDVAFGLLVRQRNSRHLEDEKNTDKNFDRKNVQRGMKRTMSVPRSIQRIVTVPRASGMLSRMKKRKGVISGMLDVRV